MSEKTVNELKIEQYKHIASIGGYLSLQESDNYNNDLNRAIIKAFYESNKETYLGNINLSGKKLKAVRAGKQVDILKKYENELVYNFEYSFIIPEKNAELENLIKTWTMASVDTSTLDKIMKKIEEIGGLLLVWS